MTMPLSVSGECISPTAKLDSDKLERMLNNGHYAQNLDFTLDGFDLVDRVRGFDITVVTTAKTDDEGRALLRALGFPFRSSETPQ